MNTFTPDRVVLDMPRERYNRLLILLGYATAAATVAQANGVGVFGRSSCLRLLNELNEGNPQYTPYAVDEEKP